MAFRRGIGPVLWTVLIVATILCYNLPAAAQVVYVCDAGDSSSPTSGDTLTAFPTIIGAINSVDPADGYDTIIVYSTINSDSYFGEHDLGYDTGLTVISAKAFYGIDTGGGADTYPTIANNQAGYIFVSWFPSPTILRGSYTINGFILNGMNTGGIEGIFFTKFKDILLTNLIIRNCGRAIELGTGDNFTITNCLIENNEAGLYINGAETGMVCNNYCAGNSGNAFDISSAPCLIENNTSENNHGWGFYIGTINSAINNNISKGDSECGFYLFMANSVFTGNRCDNVSSGFEPAGIYLWNADTNVVSNNVVTNSDSDGIGLWNANGNTIINNTISNSGRHGCVLFTQSTGNYFAQNDVDSSGGYGFCIINSCIDNTFEKNNWSPGAIYSDSAVRFATTDFGFNYLSRNYWGTSDSLVIRDVMQGESADSIIWQPYRMGMVDTTAGADTIAPAAPTTVSAQVANGKCTIVWSASSLEEQTGNGLTDLAGYRVYRADSPDTSYGSAPIAELAAGDTQYVDTWQGTTCLYAVTAFDNHSPFPNESWYSSPALATSDTAVPVVTIGLPVEGADTTVSSVWISGTITDEIDTPASVVMITDEGCQTVTTPAMDGSFGDTVYIIANGYRVVTVCCTDASGNAGSDTVGINVNDTSITLYPLTPDEQSYTNNHTPTFVWYGDADTYCFELSRDTSFAVLIDSNTRSDTSYAPAGAYDADTYYWRVRAWNQSGNGDTTAIWTFYINQDTADLNVSEVQSDTVIVFLSYGYQFSSKVKNVGVNGYSGSLEIAYYLSLDLQQDGGDTFIGSVAVGSLTLAADAETTVSATLTIPDTLTINCYYLFADVTAADSDTGNNSAHSVSAINVGATHGFSPDRDGWGFQNHPSAVWPSGAFPNWTVYRMAFGQDAVEYPDGQPKEYALQYFHDIQRSWYGSCFGFSVSSLLYHNDSIPLPVGYNDLYSVPTQTEYTDVLNSYQLYYYGENQFRVNEQTYRKPIGEFLADIIRGLLPANRDDYNELEFRSGVWHSIVPFKILHDSDTGSNKYRLYVYENNNPGWMDRAIDLDADANTWNYYNSPWGSLAGSGSNGSIFCAPISYAYTRPRIPSSYSEDYVGMANVAALQVYSGGTLVADYDDTGFTSLSDSVTGLVPPAAYGDTCLLGIFITLPRPYTIVVSRVEDAAAAYHLSLFRGGQVVDYQAPLTGGSDSITLGDSACDITVSAAREITVTVNHCAGGEEKLFRVVGFVLDAADSFALAYPAADSIALTTTADTAPLYLELEYHTNGQHQTRRPDSFVIRPEAEATVENADWANLGTELVIQLVYPDDTGLSTVTSITAPLVIGDTTIVRLILPRITQYDTVVIVMVNDQGSTVCLGVPVYNPRTADYGETIDLDLNFAGTDTGQRITVRRVAADSCAAGGVDKYADYASTMFDFSVADSAGQTIGGNPAAFEAVNLTYRFIPGNYPAEDLAALALFTWNEASGSWEEVPGAATDRQAGTISAPLGHFSIYGIFPAVGFAAPATDLNNVIIYPNPYQPNDGNPITGSPYTGAGNSSGIYINGLVPGTKIEVYDLRGRLVEELATPSGTGAVQWDVRNTAGEEVASGVYFVLLKNGSEQVVKKLFIVR